MSHSGWPRVFILPAPPAEITGSSSSSLSRRRSGRLSLQQETLETRGQQAKAQRTWHREVRSPQESWMECNYVTGWVRLLCSHVPKANTH